MLRFERMVLHNFGPYKGDQVINFDARDGVTVFWGNNGTGKTTLLNAFRYVLFGVIQTRSGVKSYRSIENRSAQRDGDFGFHVSLTFENGGCNYELTRCFRPAPDVTIPRSEDDYRKEVFLRKNGAILAVSDAEKELARIMPEQVSRFFLFDGELLQEYEELVTTGDNAGSCRRIKEAIEKILGLPVLTNGRADLSLCLHKVEAQRDRVLQQDQRTQQVAAQLASADAGIREMTASIEAARLRLSDCYREKEDLKEKLKQTERVRELMGKGSAKQDQIAQIEVSIAQTLDELRPIVRAAWKGMVQSRVEEIEKVAQAKLRALDQKEVNGSVADGFLNKLRLAVSERKCPICDQQLGPELLHLVEDKIRAGSSEFSGLSEEERAQRSDLSVKVGLIRKLRVSDQKSLVISLEQRLAEQRIRLEHAKLELKAIDDEMRLYADDTHEIRELSGKLEHTVQIISITETAINEEESKLEDLKNTKRHLTEMINHRSAGGDVERAVRRQTLCEMMYKIFEEGVGRYRDQLRERVQEDSSRVFKSLSNDPGYVGLKINDNYGLEMVDADGGIVPGRSSGFEHIVALSLIAALHKNAPLRGPIIMDSPFGRLDNVHSANVIKALPNMEKQTVLLVFEGEIPPQETREALGGHLLREHYLQKDLDDPYHTYIR